MYLTGYNGTTRTAQQLQSWSQWKGLDPEFARRILAIMDASIVAGRPLGVGGTIRTIEGQERLFLSRHYPVAKGGCCSYRGQRFALRPDVAHAAPPGRSYHEPVTAAGKCLAIDWIGNYRFLAENCAAYGLNEFSKINKEPWHSQPSSIPRGRSAYRPARDEPLEQIALPGAPAPAPTRVEAPTPTIRQGGRNVKAEVRELQVLCNFWRWLDTTNRTLLVDGDYGPKSAQAVMAMQRALGLHVDGVYGPASARALQGFLDAMAEA